MWQLFQVVHPFAPNSPFFAFARSRDAAVEHFGTKAEIAEADEKDVMQARVDGKTERVFIVV